MLKSIHTRWLLLLSILILVLGGIGIGFGSKPSKAHAAADVLILSTTVTNGSQSFEARAAQLLGLTVNIVDPAAWSSMTTVDFASYKAIILGDPQCSYTDTTPVASAIANETTWGPAITGNVVIVGTDPSYHASLGVTGAIKLIRDSMRFATSAPGQTGAYISLSCYYANASSGTPVPLLDAFSPGGFSVEGQGACPDHAHLLAAPPAFYGLHDIDLANWGCSIHEMFDTSPGNFQHLAMNEDNLLGYIVIHTSASSPTGTQPQLIFPFSAPGASDPEQWIVIQGYNTGSHLGYNRFAFDLQHTDKNGNGCDSCTKNQPVLAAASGVVAFTQTSTGCVALRHNSYTGSRGTTRWYFTIYCHLLTPLSVTPGQTVAQGQQIGLAWNTHTSSSCSSPCPYHIHFALFSASDQQGENDRRAVQPLSLIGLVVRDSLGDGGYVQYAWPWDGSAVNQYGNPPWMIEKIAIGSATAARQRRQHHAIRHPQTPNRY